MSRIFDVVKALSGQKNFIVIPSPYLDFFKGDPQAHLLGAILNQLVHWSGVESSLDNGWFYKKHEQLAEEIRGVTEDQVRKAIKKLVSSYFPDAIETATRKVNGTPTMHYRLNGDVLIAKLFPSELDSAISPNGNGSIAELKRQRSQMDSAEKPQGNGNIAESYLYTDHYTDHNLQINKTIGQSPAATDPQQVDSLKIDYSAVLEAYHATLPEMPGVLDMTKDRQTKLRALWKKYDLNLEKWSAYLRYISKKCRWMLEDRPDTSSGKTWRRKNFDYLITEKCYLAVKEVRADDLPKVPKMDTETRREAFDRLILRHGKAQNTVEKTALSMAGGLGRMNETSARIEWNGIWAKALDQVSENELRRLAS
ncbi:hypothetical protein CV016_03990 [Yersinia kristensenii]|uniref:hypothetical protein n=1 Tax=Yersinia kristensenii TaxID=28152 RepID=UPI000C22159B|nr:hypothetical protein [Yersinia kristensenii]PJG64204.1 hypothetical protein CV016_03990 [Yersinia kristensenii]